MLTYDFAKVVVLVGGVEITGFADGDDAISVTPDADLYEKTVGNDGEFARAKLNNAGASAKLKLMQTAPSNAALAALAASGEVVPFVVKDGGSLETCVTGEAWVKRVSDVGYGRKVGAREWSLDLGKTLIAPLGYALAGVV